MTLDHTSSHLALISPFALSTMGVVSLVLLQGCNGADVVSQKAPTILTSSVFLEDSVLTSRVKAALLMSPVEGSINIGVESHRGVVLLSGMAPNATQRDLAMFVALNVRDVTQVDNFMFTTLTTPAAAQRAGDAPATSDAKPARPGSSGQSSTHRF